MRCFRRFCVDGKGRQLYNVYKNQRRHLCERRKKYFSESERRRFCLCSDLLLEVFSASLFIGSKRLISYIGILIIVCAVSFTVLCFLVVKNHRGRFKSKGTRIFLRVLSIIICIMLCLAGITIDGILYTDTVKKATSDVQAPYYYNRQRTGLGRMKYDRLQTILPLFLCPLAETEKKSLIWQTRTEI